MTDKTDQLTQKIEREVRQLIGDQHIQIIMLRSIIEVQGQQEPTPPAQPEPQKPQPNPARPENPEPGRPGPSPDMPPPSPSRSPVPDPARGAIECHGGSANGHYQERIAK